MKKILICALNSKYIHTNLAIRYINSCLQKNGQLASLREFNINQPFFEILESIFSENSEIIFFSVYIWNIEYILKIVNELKKISPHTKIVLGGPEVSYQAEKLLQNNPGIDFIIKGEGEEAAVEIANDLFKKSNGIYYRQGLEIIFNGEREPLADLDLLPFPYTSEDISSLKEQIIYYESSRGCPFNCAYCLSSLDKSVRYFSLPRVKEELSFFLEHKVKLVKFVDRTFNLDPKRYLEIWKHIIACHNGVTTFHFEISAELLSSEALQFLQTIPPGIFQFEIGIQSTNPQTLEIIQRPSDQEKITTTIQTIGKNIHLHLDILAGLPAEGISTLAKSFNFAMSLKPDMLQLGFLKILHGTAMENLAKLHNYNYLDQPPYEVLSTPWLSTTDIFKLKLIEKTLNIFYNSGKFKTSLNYICQTEDIFKFFLELSDYLKTKNIFTAAHPYNFYYTKLYEYLTQKQYPTLTFELLKFDLLFSGKQVLLPEWVNKNYSKSAHLAALEKFTEFKTHREAFAKTDYAIFSINPQTLTKTPSAILFIYSPGSTSFRQID